MPDTFPYIRCRRKARSRAHNPAISADSFLAFYVKCDMPPDLFTQTARRTPHTSARPTIFPVRHPLHDLGEPNCYPILEE